jgi:hypothetical protein
MSCPQPESEHAQFLQVLLFYNDHFPFNSPSESICLYCMYVLDTKHRSVILVVVNQFIRHDLFVP